MSLFYQSLSYWDNLMFKRRKKAFKRGKSCAVCGKKYPANEMMVAHIIPVRQLSDYDALYDTTNWEVRCIYCERRLNREETLRRERLEKIARAQIATRTRESIVPRYEVDIYLDYEKLVQHGWDKASAGLKKNRVYCRSHYWNKLLSEVKKADRMTLAKAAAKFIMTHNGRMPTQEEVYEQLAKDFEAKMMFETNGNFKKEKGVK